jgi:hypothetical protein
MAENQRGTVFSRLLDTLRGFRTGVDTEQQKKILTNNPPVSPYSSVEQKQQEFLDVQSSKIAYDLYTRSIYYDTDRLTSYNDFKAMDNSPEISAALDILTDECCSRSEKGEILQIYSNNSRIKNVLKNLFFNSLNINYNLMFWSREMMKFGDCFVKLEVDRKYGVHDCNVLPAAEIHREEAYDGNLNSTRFRWDLNNMYFEEWQIAHFRIATDSARLPYGRSILEPARKLWKQLQLAEDAMLVYRMVRAPERRVYYIEVGNTDPKDVPQYMEKMKAAIKKSSVVDPKTGQVNLKYNPLPVWKNTPIPLLDGRTLTIEDLAIEYESGKENFVYSVQDNTNKIVAGKVVWCGKNYTAKILTKVWLDDDTWVLTAPEHPFVLRDGTCKRADELMSGDALMPFYTKKEKLFKNHNTVKDYLQIYNPETGKYEFVHRLVASEIEKGDKNYNTIHHKNFDKFDNSVLNLEWVDFHEHKKIIIRNIFFCFI